jgi:Xaa-Pro aminopeptidase
VNWWPPAATASPADQPISFQTLSGSGSVANMSEYSGSTDRRRPGRVAL